MLADELMKRKVVAHDAVGDLNPDVGWQHHVAAMVMLLIDVGCKFDTFWKKCATNIVLAATEIRE